jgi:hypothetical protein
MNKLLRKSGKTILGLLKESNQIGVDVSKWDEDNKRWMENAYNDVFLNHGGDVPMNQFAERCLADRITRAQLADTEFMCGKVDSWTGGLGPPIG